MKAEYRSAIRLSSPGVQQATMPAMAIRRATNSSEMPIYHVMILQFTGVSQKLCCKIIARIIIYQHNYFYLCIDKINQHAKP